MKNGYIQKCQLDQKFTTNGNIYKLPSLYRIYSKNCYESNKQKDLDSKYIYSMIIEPGTYECTNMQSTSLTNQKTDCINCCLHTKSINCKQIKHFDKQNSTTHSIDVRCNDPKRYLREFGVIFF